MFYSGTIQNEDKVGKNNMEGKARCCQECTGPCAGDFKKVADLQYSGLVIYLHTKKDEQKKAGLSKIDDSYIVHNTSSKQLKRPEYISELHQFKTKCGQCRTIVQRVRSLLDEIRGIRENEVIGVCEHCKRASLNKSCKRCDFIVTKFISLYQKKCEERRQRFKIWLCRVKHLLQAILDSESVCQHRVYKDTELERFLRQLKAPLSMREPDIDFFPNFDQEQMRFKSLSESKDKLDELLGKIKFEGEKRFSSDESLYPSPSKETCICKYLKEGRFGGESSGLGTGKSWDFSKLLSQDVYKKLIKRLVDLSKALPQDLNLNKELIQELIETLNTAINQGLTIDIIKKLIKELSELSKTLTHDLSADLNSQVIQGLIKDLNELLTLGSSQDLNKDLIQLLVDLTELLTHELSRGLSLHEDTGQVLSKSLHKEVKQGLPASQSKSTRQSSSGSHKVVTQGLPKVIHKEVEHGSPKSQRKERAHGVSKRLDKQTTLSPHKEITQALPKSKGLSKDIAPKDIIKRKTPASPKDLNKTIKDIKKESTTIKSKEKTKPLLKDTKRQLVKKLGDLNKALAGVNLDQQHIEELTRGINNTLGQGSPDLNNKIIHELTGLCKPAAQGIPRNADTGLIQSLLKDTSKAMLQGLSKDEDKKAIQELLKNLNKAMYERARDEKQNKDLKKGIFENASKGLSSGLLSKALRPVSKDASKKSQFEEDDSRGKKVFKSKDDDFKGIQVSGFEEDILKKINKMGTGTSKKKSPTGQTTKETKIKLSTKEKENLSPEDEKKKEKKPKERESKLEKKSLSSEKTQRRQRMSDAILLRMLQDNKDSSDRYQLDKERELAKKGEIGRKKLTLAMKHLPVKKEIKIPQVPDEVYSESILVCDIGQTRVPKVMVRGNTIVPYDPRYKEAEDMPMEPLIFNTRINFPEPGIFGHTPGMENISPHSKSMKRASMDFGDDGIIRYRLSNREFIDKGWTKLPTEKIMRRMNIYRMEPASPQYDWFERHKQEREFFYDNGVRLADIDDNGRGHWYYRNGAVALDYYNAEELNVGQRYVVYSSGEEMDYGRLKPRTVLALFDFLGNGVVYDHYGNVRLKYNQSEGLLVDPKLGPPGKWKWHTLNDPPVLQQVFINTGIKHRDHDLKLVPNDDNNQDAGDNVRRLHPEMLAIELDNFVKEKAHKHLQKFRPFQIRMKAVKVNQQFALKILDQANIYLLFRDGVTNLKLNLGMLLISDEIIDTDTSDMTDVATPYDKLPPRTDSVENIQKILKTVRSGKFRSSSASTDKGSI